MRALRRTLVGGAAVALSAGFMVAVPTSADAAVPTFPDNIVVFPDRDFVSVEGYENHVGETATLEVTRPGVGLIGSAQAVVEAGGVAFEVNHPGGVCWGNGTGLKVTPDIVGGDVVSIRFGATAAGDVRTGTGTVTADAVQTGDTVTVSGTLGPDVVQAQTEQRIIEPALVDTAIGRRDIRAIPGPLTPDPRGGYASSLLFPTDTTFVATYVFNDPPGPETGADIAAIAANADLGERFMSWEVVDAVNNRQGITIAEFGEAGGPGVGGCPNGPLQSGPPGPTDVLAARQTNGDIKLTWTPAVPIPGTPAITGYRVHAIGATGTAVAGNTEQVEIGKRITGAGANGTTLTGLSATETYSVEVVSVSSVGETFPAITAIPVVDTTPPVVTANPAGASFAVPQNVTLTSNEAGSQIYFTTDGTDPVDPGTAVVGATARLYTAPIAISADTLLRYAAFDPSNNLSGIVDQQYTITNTPVPDAPTITSSSVGLGSVTVNWAALADPTVTSYSVQLYSPVDSPSGAARTVAAGTLTTTFTGLVEGQAYWVTVAATNVNGTGPESAKAGPLTPQGAVVANAGPDQSVNRGVNATTVNLTGAGSTAGATYQWSQVTADGGSTAATGADAVTITNPTSINASFSLRTFALPQTNNPKFFRLTVTTAAGSKSDWVKVTPVPGQVVIATARWRAGDFRVTGADSLIGTTVTLYTVAANGQPGTALGSGVVTAAAAPATGGAFDIRLRNGAAPATNPGRIFAVSTDGGIAGPFTVS